MSKCVSVHVSVCVYVCASVCLSTSKELSAHNFFKCPILSKNFFPSKMNPSAAINLFLMKWSLFQRCVSLFHLCLLESDVRVNRVRNARYDNPEKKGHRLEKKIRSRKKLQNQQNMRKKQRNQNLKKMRKSGIVIDKIVEMVSTYVQISVATVKLKRIVTNCKTFVSWNFFC